MLGVFGTTKGDVLAGKSWGDNIDLRDLTACGSRGLYASLLKSVFPTSDITPYL